MGNRQYDVVILGATGFTGGLVADYFAANVEPGKIRWAIAGRSVDKLEAVKIRLLHQYPDCKSVGVIVCDTNQLKSVEKMTAQTKMIVTTVGPFALYGANVVKACVKTGTHYCDITGEPEFVKQMVRDYDAAAREKGIYITHCCGFDSIPADAGTYFTAMQLPANETKQIKGFVTTNAAFSGGTYASAIHAMSGIGKSVGEKPESSEKQTAKQALPEWPYYEKTWKKWAVPMPVIDPWIVRRTAKSRPQVFGSGFSYAQYLALPDLPKVVKLVASVGAVAIGAQIPPVKEWLLQFKKSGDGPSEAKRAKSWFKVDFIGESETKKVQTRVSGGDPGYTETSKMLSETALTILEHEGQLPLAGGVVTPAGVLGHLLIEKLEAKGIRFEVLESSFR